MPNMKIGESFTPASPDIYNKIRNYYNSSDKEENILSDQEERILKRWKSAYDFLQIEKKLFVSRRLQKMYEITERQAYRDIERSIQLFNPIHKHDKDFKQIMLINWIEEDLRAVKKIQNIEKRIRLSEKLYDRLYKAVGLDKQDIERIDPEMLGGNILIASFKYGDKTINIDLDNTSFVPKVVKEQLLRDSFEEITIEDAEILLEPNKED